MKHRTRWFFTGAVTTMLLLAAISPALFPATLMADTTQRKNAAQKKAVTTVIPKRCRKLINRVFVSKSCGVKVNAIWNTLSPKNTRNCNLIYNPVTGGGSLNVVITRFDNNKAPKSIYRFLRKHHIKSRKKIARLSIGQEGYYVEEPSQEVLNFHKADSFVEIKSGNANKNRNYFCNHQGLESIARGIAAKL